MTLQTVTLLAFGVIFAAFTASGESGGGVAFPSFVHNLSDGILNVSTLQRRPVTFSSLMEHEQRFYRSSELSCAHAMVWMSGLIGHCSSNESGSPLSANSSSTDWNVRLVMNCYLDLYCDKWHNFLQNNKLTNVVIRSFVHFRISEKEREIISKKYG